VYFTSGEYCRWRLETFISECRHFFHGEATIPATKSENAVSPREFVTFTFTCQLLRKLMKHERKLDKSYEAGVQCGYRYIIVSKRAHGFFRNLSARRGGESV
jgi:hypothetical protein